MKLGLIARADNRGLGIQTWEFFRHLPCAKVLVVDMQERTPYPSHLGRFVKPLAEGEDFLVEFVKVKEFSAQVWRNWLQDLDVVLTAETPYDFQLYEIAREMKVRTVCQINPELFHYPTSEMDTPRPDVFVNPSVWRMNELSSWDVRHLPFPVDRERLLRRKQGRVNVFLHVAGHRAFADRNGTMLVAEAVKRIRHPCRLVVRTQSRLPKQYWRPSKYVQIDVVHEDVENYWDLYSEGDALILPRRYGGQCLPINEAASLGMPIVGTRRTPEQEMLVDASTGESSEGLIGPLGPHKQIKMQGGMIDLESAHPRELARVMDRLLEDEGFGRKLSDVSDDYAESISWENMLPRYTSLLEGRS